MKGTRTRPRGPAARLALLSLLALGLVLSALFAYRLCPCDPYRQDLSNALQPPGPGHPLGTDRHGRDMLSRVIAGGRVSILSALALTGLSALFGALLGTLCGWAGGWADALLTRLCDVCLAFPGLVLALAVAALLGGGVANAVAALFLVSWPKYARLSRSRVLSLRSAPFIAAARLSGTPPPRLLLRHVLPNLLGPVLTTAALDIGAMMTELAGLSFLGLGAQAPTAEWGSMMSGGRSMLQTYPWTVLAPGGAIFLTVSVFNLLGDALRDWADAKGRGA